MKEWMPENPYRKYYGVFDEGVEINCSNCRVAYDKGGQAWAGELVKWLDKKMVLEQCDASVMPYFNDYYWIDKEEWQQLNKDVGL